MQTAQPVAERLNLEIRTDPRLMEIPAEVFQERLRSELEEFFQAAAGMPSRGAGWHAFTRRSREQACPPKHAHPTRIAS